MTDGTDEPLDPYDPAYINRSIFGSKMKGHRQTWPDIDLGELKAINPDCVGWVHMDRSPIDYPVVLGRFDPTYNLTHNFSGEESVHGQVYLDFRHGGRPSGRTCVLHAHHMKDWSMFKAIVSLEDPEYLAAHPAVELIHGDAHCIARWFAGVNYRSGYPWPERTRFADDADFDAWLSRVMAETPGAKMDVDEWHPAGTPFESPVGALTTEQSKRLIACRTPEEIGAFAQREGIALDALTYEALAMYAGE